MSTAQHLERRAAVLEGRAMRADEKRWTASKGKESWKKRQRDNCFVLFFHFNFATVSV